MSSPHPPPILPDPVLGRRVRRLRSGEGKGPVIYWMSRDQRVMDNWALWHAFQLAKSQDVELRVAFCLVSEYLGASDRHYRFMLKGLNGLESDLIKRGVPFDLLQGDPPAVLPGYIRSHDVGTMVVDFDPLRPKQRWRSEVMTRVDCTWEEVDAHNIVPCWVASPKKEYAAATFRPKLNRLLPEFIDDVPGKIPVRANAADEGKVGWSGLLGPGPGTDPKPNDPPAGERAGRAKLEEFIALRLDGYAERRNDPTLDGQSGLSPYLHFGMISAQRVALEVQACKASQNDKAALLEELVVRRELSDNFCYYDKEYDSSACFPAWAQISLRQHERDRREYVYSLDELEGGRTHDALWNAAQEEMKVRGKMHGYLRMYWAKKVLEWSETAEQAMTKAITLNDRHELDGRDPNGYAGVAWSIGGLHDRAWADRPIFGKVRYMSYNGARHKFDVDRYVDRWSGGH